MDEDQWVTGDRRQRTEQERGGQMMTEEIRERMTDDDRRERQKDKQR